MYMYTRSLSLSLSLTHTQAPSLFAEVPGPARRRVICAYTASVDDTGLAATRELAVGALKVREREERVCVHVCV